MEYWVSLVTPPCSHAILHEVVHNCRMAVKARAEPDILGDGEAAQFALDLADSFEEERCKSALRQAIQALAARTLPVDWCLMPAGGRRKRMLIADMDSTIIAQECLDEMADLKGIKPQIAELTERAMRGELDFEGALRERVRLLAGLTKADLRQVLDNRITLNDGARTLVRTMARHGAHAVLVSGGFTFFTGAVATMAGFTSHRANSFIWDGAGGLSGVQEPILGREAKLSALREEAAARGLSAMDVLAVGDGANDLAMLKAAGLGVAFHAKPIVAAEAQAQVNHTSLTTLLYFQGYRREAFTDI
jgi:phosphoserine phosphatase